MNKNTSDNVVTDRDLQKAYRHGIRGKVKQHKKALIVAVILLVLILSCTSYYYLVLSNTKASSHLTFSQNINSISDQENLGNYNKALSGLSSIKPQNKSQQYTILVKQGLDYAQLNQNQKALNAYLSAYHIDPSNTDDSILAEIGKLYGLTGNKTMAINYYNKAIDLIKTPKYQYDEFKLPSYQYYISQLEKK